VGAIAQKLSKLQIKPDNESLPTYDFTIPCFKFGTAEELFTFIFIWKRAGHCQAELQ